MFKVGDLLRVLPGFGTKHFGVGNELICTKDQYEQLGAPFVQVRTNDGDRDYFAKRFELVEPAPVAAAPLLVEEVEEIVALPVFQVGDKVRIVRKVEEVGKRVILWDALREMDRLFDEKVVGEVIRPIGHIDNAYRVKFANGKDWSYLVECLKLAEDVAVPNVPPLVRNKEQKKKAVKPKKEEKPSLRAAMRKEWGIGKDNKEKYKDGYGGICSYALQFADGSIRYQKRDACHYRIRTMHPEKEVTGLALSLWRVEHDLGDVNLLPLWMQYADYIINRSPWAVAFQAQRMSTLRRYGLLMNVDVSIDIIAGACIALREGTEFSGKLHVFDIALKKGFSEDVALLLANCLSYNKHTDSFSITGVGGGHQVFTGPMNAKQVFDFVANGYNEERIITKGPYRTNNRNYFVFNSIAKSEGASISDWVKKHAPKKQIGEGWNAKYIVTMEGFVDLGNKIVEEINQQKKVKA